MSYAIHIYGHATGDEAAAIEGALHAKFTAMLLELRHVTGHGLTSAHFEGQHVEDHLGTLPAPGSAVTADEQSAESILASREPSTDPVAPGSAVVMDEQDGAEIERLRAAGAGSMAGHVVEMEEQSAESIATSRVASIRPPPGAGNLYENQAPIREEEKPAEEPLVPIEATVVPEPLPLPADGEILTDEATGQQYRFNATTLRLVKYTAAVEEAAVEAVSEEPPIEEAVTVEAPTGETVSQDTTVEIAPTEAPVEATPQ